MTILHILDHSIPVFSGYSFRSRSIVRFQERLGLRPVVLTSPKQGNGSDGVETIEGLSYYRTGGSRGRLPFVRELGLMARLARRIAAVARAERAHLLHAHSPLLNGIPTLWAGRRLGLPVVYEARAFWEDAAVDHGTFREGSLRYRISRALETLLFWKADGIVTICEGMRREVVRRGVAPERVTVVENGVDVDWFAPHPRAEELAARLGLDGGPIFGFIGSFYHYEGLRFLMAALPELLRRMPQARLLLVGGGPDEPTLRATARAFGSSVIFAGQVPHAEIREYYSVIDVLLCPRRRMRLTELVTPLKPLEAMAMALPVLVSDVGGLAELVQHGVTGLTFPAESREGLVEQATRIGSDADLRKRLGERARAYVAEERTWARAVAKHPDLYAAAQSAANRKN
jgi:PEP-CTERM/exosortase A-associated glycosyltransferase